MEDKLNPMDASLPIEETPAPPCEEVITPAETGQDISALEAAMVEAEAAAATFEPTVAPTDNVAAHMDDLSGHINDNWLEEFLQQKMEEDAKLEAAAAEEAEEAAVEEALAVAEELTGWEPPVEEEPEDEQEIGADPIAVAAAGLVAPEDRELEQILAQDWDATTILPKTEPEEVPEEEPAEEEEYEEELPADTKKRRPRMKKGYGLLGIPHVLVTVVWLALIVMIAVPLGRLGWMWVADVMAFGKESQEVTLTITETDTIEDVSNKLADAEIVRFPGLFQKFAELTGKGERIDPGTYTLNSHLDYNALLNGMVNYGPAHDVVEIMFPEGYNCAQIFALLEKEGVCSAETLEEYAADGELAEYWFLEGVERGHKYCLEGYLAPDTYKFYTNDEPRRVLEKFLDEFDDRFTDKMKEDFITMQERYNTMLSNNGYGDEYIANNPLTLHKLITLASIVQKETAGDDESYNIASVFYNRLTDPASHPYLGSDATVYYAIGDYFGDKEDLTQEDLDFDSPYNTRNHQGLPPGPICNPGSYTMYAALDPNDTDYYYFVFSTEEQKHLFSSTLKEHEDKLKALGLW